MYCLIADIALPQGSLPLPNGQGSEMLERKEKPGIYCMYGIFPVYMHELGEISFIIVHVVYTVHLEPLWSGDCYPVHVCAAGLCVWLRWFVYRI